MFLPVSALIVTERQLSLRMGRAINACPDSGKGYIPPNKLMMPNRDSYQIVAEQREACLCRDLATNKDLLIKVHLLKPYYHDPETQDPREAALGDKQMFVIQKVLRHRDSPT